MSLWRESGRPFQRSVMSEYRYPFGQQFRDEKHHSGLGNLNRWICGATIRLQGWPPQKLVRLLVIGPAASALMLQCSLGPTVCLHQSILS